MSIPQRDRLVHARLVGSAESLLDALGVAPRPMQKTRVRLVRGGARPSPRRRVVGGLTVVTFGRTVSALQLTQLHRADRPELARAVRQTLAVPNHLLADVSLMVPRLPFAPHLLLIVAGLGVGELQLHAPAHDLLRQREVLVEVLRVASVAGGVERGGSGETSVAARGAHRGFAEGSRQRSGGRAHFLIGLGAGFRAVFERRFENRSDERTYLVEDVLIARSLASARHRGVAARGCGPADRQHTNSTRKSEREMTRTSRTTKFGS